MYGVGLKQWWTQTNEGPLGKNNTWAPFRPNIYYLHTLIPKLVFVKQYFCCYFFVKM